MKASPVFVDQTLSTHAIYSHNHHYSHDDNDGKMVRLRTDQFLGASSSANSIASTPPSSSAAAAETFPVVLLTLFRISAVLAWALVKLDALSPHASTKVYTRPGMESWKSILFMAVAVFMPSRQPALFIRFALLWAVLTFGYSLLLPGIALLNKQRQEGVDLLSLSWEEEWRRFLIMGNAVVGLALVAKLCLGALFKKRGGGGGSIGMRARRRKQL